jgi:hypothetical protein
MVLASGLWARGSIYGKSKMASTNENSEKLEVKVFFWRAVSFGDCKFVLHGGQKEKI